jgi:hypothetical protein
MLPGPDAPAFLRRCIDDFYACQECVIQSNRQGRLFSADIRPLVRRCVMVDDATLELELQFSDKKNPKVTEIISRICNFEEHAVQSLRITKLPG